MKSFTCRFALAALLGSSVLFPATLQANTPWYKHCKHTCKTCEGKGDSCTPGVSTYTVQATSETDTSDPNTPNAKCTVDHIKSLSTDVQGEPVPRGVTALIYRREGSIFEGAPPDYVKYETNDGVKKPVQMPTHHTVGVFSDLPDGSGHQIAHYLKSQVPSPSSAGLYIIPSGIQPTSVTIYRNPDGPATSTQGNLEIIHKQRHPQSGAWVVTSIRIHAPQGDNQWNTRWYQGDLSVDSSLSPYRETTIVRTPHPTNLAEESTRETTRDRDSGGNLVVTSDLTSIYGFYRYGFPVKLSETIHTGTGSDFMQSWTYYTDRTRPESFNRPATLRCSDGRWTNYTYVGSTVTGVKVTKTVTGWLDQVAPSVGAPPDESASKVITEIEAAHETGTFGREEKVQGVLVSKTWGERYKDNAGQLVEKSRVETGTSTLLTIRTGYSDDASTSEAERGRLKSIEYPDGTIQLHRYQMQGTNRVETVEKGAGTTIGITDGTRTISTYTKDDTLIKEVLVDIASGVELSAREAIAFDSTGQPTRWAYNYNPDDYSETLNGCCGVESERSRDGIVTTYTRDALKRPKTEASRGVTLTYTYGSRTVGGTVFPSENITAIAGTLTLDQGTTVHDHAGNVIQRISPDFDGDGNEEATATTRDFAARTTTVTNPDGGTVVSRDFADGQSKSMVGTATAPRYYAYTTHAEQGGGEVSSTAPAANGPWRKVYQNLAGRPIKGTFDDNTTEMILQTYGYDNLGRLISTKDADNITELMAYNAKGENYRRVIDLNQNGQIDNADRVTDTFEEVLEVSGFGPAIRRKIIVYDDANAARTTNTTLTSPDGFLSRQETLGVANSSTSVRTPHLGRVDGSWTDTIIASNGTKQATEYSNWLPISQSRLDTANTVIESITTGYDALRRPITETHSRTGLVSTTYSTSGQVASIDDHGRVTSFGYDSSGRRITVTLPDNSVVHTTYWPTGNEKANYGSQTTPTVRLYDSEGRMTKLRAFRSTDLALAPDETTSGHDETEWMYNVRGQLQRKEYADGKGTNYTYTPGNRLHTRTWARTAGGAPLVTTYGYSTAGELATTDYSDATPDVTIVFDKLGRQQTVTNSVATNVFTYDPNSLALDYETISYDLNGDSTADFTRMIDHARDSLGRGTGFQLKDGSTLENEATYTYSATSGRLATVAGAATPGTFTYSYAPGFSLIASVTGPVHTVTNTWETTRDVLDLKENKAGTTAISSYDYTVNALGQRTDVAQTGSAFAAARGIVWGYDSLGQVTSANHSTDNAFDRAYQYGAIGNRIEARDGTTAVTGTSNYAANSLNQYSAIGSLNPIHDDDGNATNYPLPDAPSNLSSLVWDAENRLISATVNGTAVSYLYDSHSRRIARATGVETTVYLCDSWNVVAEYATSDLETFELRNTYLWGTDLSGSLQGAGGVSGLLAVKSSGTVHYPTFDGNGNVSEYLDSTGTIAAHFEYDPFGNTVVNTDAAGIFPYRFSTKPVEAITGLYYYVYRWYTPATGRWLSRDPIEEEGGVNLYGFVENNGVNGTDYLGLSFDIKNAEVDGELKSKGKLAFGLTEPTIWDFSANSKDEIEESNKECCAEVKKGKEFVGVVTVTLLKGAALQDAERILNGQKLTYNHVKAHENRRAQTYALAYSEYYEGVSGTGKWVKIWGKVCCKKPGEAKASLQEYLDSARKGADSQGLNYLTSANRVLTANRTDINFKVPQPPSYIPRARVVCPSGEN